MKVYVYAENCTMAGRVAAVDPEPEDVSGDWFLWDEGSEDALIARARNALAIQRAPFPRNCARFAAEKLGAAHWDRDDDDWAYLWDEFADAFAEERADILETARKSDIVYQNEDFNTHLDNFCDGVPPHMVLAVISEIRSRAANGGLKGRRGA